MQNEYEPPKTPSDKSIKPAVHSVWRGCLAFFLLTVASVIAFVSTCFPAIYVLDKTRGPSRSHLNFDNAIEGLLIAIVVGVLVFVIGTIVLIYRWNSRSKISDKK